MRIGQAALPVLIVLLLINASVATADDTGTRVLPLTVQEDKIRGGWAGQVIGVSYGAPTEFRYTGKINEEKLDWSPDRVSNALNQDDLYVEMTFAAVMDRLGLDATTEQYGEAFKDTEYGLWHANAAARQLLNQGIKAPLSGDPRYNIHANDIDFQIESDFIGLMTPGLPRESNQFCNRIGRVMNYGDGLYGGMFVCGMYAAAFFETDTRNVVEQGLACIPPKSGYARVIRDVLTFSRQHPNDWRTTWRLLERKWDRNDSCTGGALQPFNIDARLNGAYIALGLLYGKRDWERTLEIATRCGQDSDCNPSSAAGILGVILGYKQIPDRWKNGISKIAEEKFAYTDYSLENIIQSTQKRVLAVIRRVGGTVNETEIRFPFQKPQPPRLEQWTMGVADRIIGGSDPAWKWKGKWSARSGEIEYRTPLVGKSTTTPGSEAELHFKGTAVALVGPHSSRGGRADVFIDNTKHGEANFSILANTTNDSLWHVYGLKPGKHTLRLVIRDDTPPNSECFVLGAITYR